MSPLKDGLNTTLGCNILLSSVSLLGCMAVIDETVLLVNGVVEDIKVEHCSGGLTTNAIGLVCSIFTQLVLNEGERVPETMLD